MNDAKVFITETSMKQTQLLKAIIVTLDAVLPEADIDHMRRLANSIQAYSPVTIERKETLMKIIEALEHRKNQLTADTIRKNEPNIIKELFL